MNPLTTWRESNRAEKISFAWIFGTALVLFGWWGVWATQEIGRATANNFMPSVWVFGGALMVWGVWWYISEYAATVGHITTRGRFLEVSFWRFMKTEIFDIADAVLKGWVLFVGGVSFVTIMGVVNLGLLYQKANPSASIEWTTATLTVVNSILIIFAIMCAIGYGIVKVILRRVAQL